MNRKDFCGVNCGRMVWLDPTMDGRFPEPPITLSLSLSVGLTNNNNYNSIDETSMSPQTHLH